MGDSVVISLEGLRSLPHVFLGPELISSLGLGVGQG